MVYLKAYYCRFRRQILHVLPNTVLGSKYFNSTERGVCNLKKLVNKSTITEMLDI